MDLNGTPPGGVYKPYLLCFQWLPAFAVRVCEGGIASWPCRFGLGLLVLAFDCAEDDHDQKKRRLLLEHSRRVEHKNKKYKKNNGYNTL